MLYSANQKKSQLIIQKLLSFLVVLFLCSALFLGNSKANSFEKEKANSDETADLVTVYSNDKPIKVSFNSIKSGLKLHEIGDVQMISDDSNLPIAVSNNTNYDIDLVLKTFSTSQKVDFADDNSIQKFRISANSDSTIIVKVVSRANGDATLNISLTTKNGLLIGKTKARLHIFANVGATLKFIFITLITLLIIFGSYRTIKKVHKFSRRNLTKTPENEVQHSAIFEAVKSKK